VQIERLLIEGPKHSQDFFGQHIHIKAHIMSRKRQLTLGASAFRDFTSLDPAHGPLEQFHDIVVAMFCGMA